MHILNYAINYLFDENGLHIVQWYLILIMIDTILGTVRSAMKSKLKSRTYLKGIFMKLLGIFGIVVANGLDDMLKNYMNINIGIDVSDTFAVALVGYEALSILENMHQMGIFTGKLSEIVNKFFDDSHK
jgi:toxin secretion/phage lysis holin